MITQGAGIDYSVAEPYCCVVWRKGARALMTPGVIMQGSVFSHQVPEGKLVYVNVQTMFVQNCPNEDQNEGSLCHVWGSRARPLDCL